MSILLLVGYTRSRMLTSPCFQSVSSRSREGRTGLSNLCILNTLSALLFCHINPNITSRCLKNDHFHQGMHSKLRFNIQHNEALNNTHIQSQQMTLLISFSYGHSHSHLTFSTLNAIPGDQNCITLGEGFIVGREGCKSDT